MRQSHSQFRPAFNVRRHLESKEYYGEQQGGDGAPQQTLRKVIPLVGEIVKARAEWNGYQLARGAMEGPVIAVQGAYALIRNELAGDVKVGSIWRVHRHLLEVDYDRTKEFDDVTYRSGDVTSERVDDK